MLEVAELDGTVAVRAELVEGLKPKTYLHWLSKAECEPA